MSRTYLLSALAVVVFLAATAAAYSQPPTTFHEFRRQFRVPRLRLAAGDRRRSSFAAAKTTPPPPYSTKYYDARLDHFDFTNGATFKLRYLVGHQDFAGLGSPIFFYTGNEGDIEWFANNTGLLWEFAPQFGALVVFAEHRYYGKSLPFGNNSFSDPSHLKFFSSEQALADFVDLVFFLKSKKKFSKSPVIAFGGSYGGMLAAWMRMKYPNVIKGALASSAPMWQFSGLVPCDTYSRGVTKDFLLAEQSGKCVASIIRSWGELDQIGKDDDGRQWLSTTFRLCKPLKTVNDLKGWLAGVWGNVAMVDYPYPANFLEPLPAWPIDHICKHLKNNSTGKKLMVKLRDAVNIYFNYTGQAECLDTSEDAGSSLDSTGWWYQSCTEMVFPSCSTGVEDLFEPSPWNLTAYSAACFNKWGVNPRPLWAEKYYWGKNLTTASNIVFSNGDLDPWSGGGVLKAPVHADVRVIKIKKAAHHLDLRFSNDMDPSSVKKARKFEMSKIKEFLYRP